MLDNNQSMVASYRYDPFGNTVNKSGSLADANLYRFSSKEIHLNSGMYYFGYRFYDPYLQRWINRDPIGEDGGINLYDYVENDPVDAYDPFGEWLWFWQRTVSVTGGTPQERRAVRRQVPVIWRMASWMLDRQRHVHGRNRELPSC